MAWSNSSETYLRVIALKTLTLECIQTLYSNNNNRIQRHKSRFCTISSQHPEPSPTRTFKWPGCNRVQHVQHIERLSHATCHVTWHMVRRDSSAIKFDSWNRIYFSFILLDEPINRWSREGNRSTWRKPLVASFRKWHILQPKDLSPKWDSNPHSSIGGRLGKLTFFFFFFCVPQLYLWGSPFLGEIFADVTVF